MSAPPRKFLLLVLLLAAGGAFAEDVQITVFTLVKDGVQVEALSYVSATQGGEGIYSVTTTKGEQRVLLEREVGSKENILRPIDALPEFARKKVEAQRKAGAEWAVRATAQRNEEELNQKAALVRSAETAKESDALRAAGSEEQTTRQRCAALWETQQAALAKSKAAQDSLTRARAEHDAATANQRALDRWRPNTPDEVARWRSQRQAADRRLASAEDRIKNATQDLEAATALANQRTAELAQAKTSLEQAQAKLAEAQRLYAEAQERAKRKAAEMVDRAREQKRPVEPAKDASSTSSSPSATAGAPAASSVKSTVTRSFEKGEFVQLTDGSLWEIHPEDRTVAAGWLPEQEVAIVRGADLIYTTRLVNSVTHGAVKAKRLK